jgi:hypothetical protein
MSEVTRISEVFGLLTNLNEGDAYQDQDIAGALSEKAFDAACTAFVGAVKGWRWGPDRKYIWKRIMLDSLQPPVPCSAGSTAGSDTAIESDDEEEEAPSPSVNLAKSWYVPFAQVLVSYSHKNRAPEIWYTVKDKDGEVNMKALVAIVKKSPLDMSIAISPDQSGEFYATWSWQNHVDQFSVFLRSHLNECNAMSIVCHYMNFYLRWAESLVPFDLVPFLVDSSGENDRTGAISPLHG